MSTYFEVTGISTQTGERIQERYTSRKEAKAAIIRLLRGQYTGISVREEDR